MRHLKALLVVFLTLCALPAAWAQLVTYGQIVGSITDPSGAVVAGATVQVTDMASGRVYTVTAAADGGYVVPSLAAGTYQLEVTMSGFRTARVSDIAVAVARTTTVNVRLEVGPVAEVVEVVAGVTVLETQTTSVSYTITGRQITDLPFTSRDALDLALMMPGIQTTGRPRSSTFMGLPKGAINITLDGINVQDNFLKSSDGFFTNIRPRIDFVEEFSVDTAAQSADVAGGGAVQLRFITKRGTNDWHGGAFWYHRNPALNATKWFNNAAGIENQRQLLNQFGGRIGGPIWKDKLFAFWAYDEFRLPQSVTRTRTLLSQDAMNGLFSYEDSGGSLQTVNLLTLYGTSGATFDCDPSTAGTQPCPSTRDPGIAAILDLLSAARPQMGTPTPLGPITDEVRFNNTASGTRRFTVLRLDYNISPKHAWQGIYEYNYFSSSPDTLNGFDPAFPGFPLQGGQFSNRFHLATALTSNIRPNLTNEFRFATTAARVSFFPDLDASLYPAVPGVGSIRPDFPIMSDPIHDFATQFRSAPVYTWYDNLAVVRGRHNMQLGVSFTHTGTFYSDFFAVLPSLPEVSFGVLTAADPADQMFNTTNFPGIGATDLATAKELYGLVVGRVTSLSGAVHVSEQTRQYQANIPLTHRLRQREWGIYGSDRWRVTPSLTLNYGVRYVLLLPPTNTNNIWATSGPNGIWGVSGPGNLFSPGTLTGSPTVYDLLGGQKLYNTDKDNFAPSIGLAWNPRFTSGALAKLFGDAKTVIRAGYSINYTREGTANYIFMTGANPGPFAFSGLTADVEYPAGGWNLSGGPRDSAGNPVSPTLEPPSFSFPLDQARFRWAGLGVNEVDVNLKVPYVQSWSFGLQREVTPNMALEVRYVGNHAVHLYRQINLNEINIFENGFLSEFRNAVTNVALCRTATDADGNGRNDCLDAQAAAGATTLTVNNFANWGLAGQVALPISTAAFTASTTGAQTNSSFRSGTFVSLVDTGNVADFGRLLATNLTRYNNLVTAGFPVNFWMVNPDAITGDVWFMTNGSTSTYNGVTVEFRRRMSQGLMFNVNYTWSHALNDFFASSSTSFRGIRSLRLGAKGDRGPSPFDIRQAFKLNWIYELPLGPGRRWSAASGWANRFLEGWAVHGIGRIQTGRVFLLDGNRFTFSRFVGSSTANDAGVNLVGITRAQLQSMISVRKEPNGQVFWLPAQLIGSDGRPDPSFILPCETPGQLCDRVFLYGPYFNKFDLSIVKKTKITERIDAEFRFEFLNAFNTVNFMVGSPGSDVISDISNVSVTSTSFGRITHSYEDLSTTNDVGARMIQFVFRINF